MRLTYPPSRPRNSQKTVPEPTPANATTRTPPSQDRPPQKSALTALRPHLILWITAAVGLALDLSTKKWALAALAVPDQAVAKAKIIIPDYLCFRLVQNPGAIAGFAAGRTSVLIFVSLAALVLLFWLFICSRANQWPIHLALGMLFAGALGNTCDRIFNSGKVIDFIEVNLHFPPANPWPTFNIADILLCVGVGILLLTMLRLPKSQPPQIPASPNPSVPKEPQRP